LKQQTDASTRAPDIPPSSVDAPQLVAAKAQTKRKAQTGTKAQPKWQKAIPSSPPQPAPLSRPEPTNALEQMIDPSEQGTSSAVAPEQTITTIVQGMPSVVVFQEFTANKSAKKLPLIPLLFNSAAEDIPLAGPANQGIL
jgi:hypothetical protein